MPKPNVPPLFTDLLFELNENSSTGTMVVAGKNYVRDKGDTLTFTFEDPSGLFAVNPLSGDISFTGAPSSLDFETANFYTLQVTATDSANNIVSNAVTIQIRNIDETPPATPVFILASGSDTGFSTTDKLTRDTLPSVSGTTQKGTTVELYDNGMLVATITPKKSNGAWNYAFIQPLSEGTHALEAVAVNSYGINSAPSLMTLTIDTTAPATTVAGISEDTGTSSTDGTTSDTTLAFSGTSEADSLVQVFSGALLLGSTTADAVGNWLFDYTHTSLAAGMYEITASAIDAAGNQGAASAVFELTIDAGIAAPFDLDLMASSDSGSSSMDDLTNDVTPKVSGIAAAEIAVLLFDTDGTTLLGSGFSDVDGLWSITAAPLVDGSHTLTAKAVDNLGNLSIASTALVVNIDTVAPSASANLDLAAGSDSGRSQTDDLTSDSTPTVNGTAEANSIVDVLLNGSTSLGTAIADASGEWSLTTTTLAEGVHFLTFHATDAAGNTNFAPGFLPITIDTSAPAATLVSASSESGSGIIELDAVPDAITTKWDYEPQIAAVGTSGDYVVVWSGIDGDDDDTSIYVQAFNADNTFKNAMVKLEAEGFPNSFEFYPKITTVGDAGAYAVTWKGFNIEEGGSIFVQLFNADASTQGNQVALENPAFEAGVADYPQIAEGGTNGEYVVVWQASNVYNFFDVLVQTFNADGTPQGIPVTLGQGGPQSTHSSPQISAVGTSGEYVVTWTAWDESSGLHIQAQHFLADHTLAPAGVVKLFGPGSDTQFGNRAPQVAGVGNAGDYAIAWQASSSRLDGNTDIFVQLFDSDDAPKGDLVHLQPDQTTNGWDNPPIIKALAGSGNYVVVWEGLDGDSDSSIFVQLFNADGTVAHANPYLLEAEGSTGGFDTEPHVTATGSDGEYLVTFRGLNAESSPAIIVQAFNADGTPNGTPLEVATVGSFAYPQIAAVGNDHDYVIAWQGVGENEQFNDNSILVWPSSTEEDSAIIQSTETGAAYLVHTSVVVNSESDITGAADELWNSVETTAPYSDTYLPKTGLSDGVYNLYTADVAGNLSEVVLVGQILADSTV